MSTFRTRSPLGSNCRGMQLHRALALTAFLAGCRPEAPVAPVAPVCTVRSVSVSPPSLSMLRGETQFLSASVDASNCSQTAPNWSSGNDFVARVSSTGVVTAVAPGSAIIVATVSGLSGSTRITVAAEPIVIVVPVASIAVSPPTLALAVGQSSQLTATLRDAAGTALGGRIVTWTSSNRAIADVSSSGVVSAVSGGTAQITATSEGRSASAVVSVVAPARNVTVTVTNALIFPITVNASGVPLGDVPAESSQSFTLGQTGAVRISWSLRRPAVAGREIGDPMAGFWDLSSPGATVQLTVDNVVGDAWYFAPLVTNSTGTTLLMTVNWGLASENRCNCTVPATGALTHLGYYRLFTNSNVTAFRSGSNYTGAYRYFYDFTSGVTRGAGRAFFTFNVAP